MKIERSKNFKPWSLSLTSGCDEYPGCKLVAYAFGLRVEVPMPNLIKPSRIWKDTSMHEWGKSNGGGYWDIHRREYGFMLSDGHFSLYLGRQTHDSSTEQTWSCFLPWTQWRFVRIGFYGLQGERLFWVDYPKRHKREPGVDHFAFQRVLETATPKRAFRFKDFDGEEIVAITKIEQREWLFGTGWFTWLSAFRRRKISRILDIEFTREVGQRKGSWKGGTIGHSIELQLPIQTLDGRGELHETGFYRYCCKHNLTYIGECPVPPPKVWPKGDKPEDQKAAVA